MTVATRTFDDLAVGMTETSPARTVTDADVAAFADLSGDHNPLHTDEQHAIALGHRARLAHGLLGVAIASGLFTLTALSRSLQPSVVALLAVEARFRAPLYIGDSVHVVATVSDLRPASSGGRGIATVARVLVNQDAAIVQEITAPLLLRGRLLG